MHCTDSHHHEVFAKPKRGLRVFAVERHHEIEQALEDLARARARADPHVLATRWRALDGALRDHLDAEEDLILPAYQAVAPEAAATLRTDHARIREALDAIELDVRHRVLHPARVQRLIELLRAHAEYEEASLYAWAERQLPLVVRRQLLVRIAN